MEGTPEVLYFTISILWENGKRNPALEKSLPNATPNILPIRTCARGLIYADFFNPEHKEIAWCVDILRVHACV